MPPFLFARRYEPLALLGKGGFGVVWRARDRNLRREVALKLFRQGAPVFQAYYEAQLLTALESPHILQIFDASTYQDIPHITTAVAERGSTEEVMAPFGVPVPLAVSWARHLLVGLEACHASGIVHRDIKPSNLFLKSLDHALLGDLGVAALLNDSGRAPAHGDWKVRAPELYAMGITTPQSDIWSVGVCLYALLTGVYPFLGSPPEIEDAVVNARHRRLRDVAPHVSKALAMRVERAMDLDMGSRFASAADMHASLGQLPVVTRVWERIAPHDAHEACWQANSSGGHSALQVCVSRETPKSHSIETCKIPSGRRIKPLCLPATGAQLPGRLRKVFSSLQ